MRTLAKPDDIIEVEKELDNAKETLKNRENGLRQFQMFGIKVIAALLVVWALFFWVIGIASMPSDDMYPRIDAGDMLLFYRLDKEIHAQDIIVFVKDDTRYVGRVIAVAGDTVDITDDEAVVVNGNVLTEHNIFVSTPRYEGFTEYPLKLGSGEYFVLVDQRKGGEDSRFFGPVTGDEISGVVITLMRRNKL